MKTKNLYLTIYFLIFVVVGLVGFVFFQYQRQKGSGGVSGGGGLPPRASSTPSVVGPLIPISSTCGVGVVGVAGGAGCGGGGGKHDDAFNDAYFPPLKQNLQTPFIPPQYTRRCNQEFTQMGILKNRGRDLILPLFGREVAAAKYKYQYYTISNTGNLHTKLPLCLMRNGKGTYNRNKSCMSEYGCDEIFNDDKVYVQGYDDTFDVVIYDSLQTSYMPVL